MASRLVLVGVGLLVIAALLITPKTTQAPETSVVAVPDPHAGWYSYMCSSHPWDEHPELREAEFISAKPGDEGDAENFRLLAQIIAKRQEAERKLTEAEAESRKSGDQFPLWAAKSALAKRQADCLLNWEYRQFRHPVHNPRRERLMREAKRYFQLAAADWNSEH